MSFASGTNLLAITSNSEKRCTGCKENKPLDEFTKMTKSKDGLAYKCKACVSELAKIRREKDPDRLREQSRLSYHKHKEDISQRKKEDRLKNPEKYRRWQRESYEINKEKKAAYVNAYIKTEKGKEVRQKTHQAYCENNIEKRKAKSIVNNRVRSGKLEKKPCEYCGSTERIEAHHYDYSKPLDVTWFCKKHHCFAHKVDRELRRAS